MIRAALCRFLNIAPVWDPSGDIPPPPVPSVALPEDGTMEEILEGAVKACYDIERDDRLLRGLFEIPAEERGRYFMGLRTGYRLRREFSSIKVISGPADISLRRALADVGFRL
jgi:hypothetical protein